MGEGKSDAAVLSIFLSRLQGFPWIDDGYIVQFDGVEWERNPALIQESYKAIKYWNHHGGGKLI